MLNSENDKFVGKIFTENEALYCRSKANPSIHFAGRFAAKEAIKKCVLSSGIIDSLDFNDIEVVSKSNGAPIVTKINKISYSELQISISHEKDYAIAMAMVLL